MCMRAVTEEDCCSSSYLTEWTDAQQLSASNLHGVARLMEGAMKTSSNTENGNPCTRTYFPQKIAGRNGTSPRLSMRPKLAESSRDVVHLRILVTASVFAHASKIFRKISPRSLSDVRFLHAETTRGRKECDTQCRNSHRKHQCKHPGLHASSSASLPHPCPSRPAACKPPRSLL